MRPARSDGKPQELQQEQRPKTSSPLGTVLADRIQQLKNIASPTTGFAPGTQGCGPPATPGGTAQRQGGAEEAHPFRESQQLSAAPPPRPLGQCEIQMLFPRALGSSHVWEVPAEAREGVEAQAGEKAEPALFTDDKTVYEEHPKE